MNPERRTTERRTSKERRYQDVAIMAPDRRIKLDRRSGSDRRTGLPSVCVCCGKVCKSHKEWLQGAVTQETKIEYRTGICMECSKKKFPQYYNDG